MGLDAKQLRSRMNSMRANLTMMRSLPAVNQREALDKLNEARRLLDLGNEDKLQSVAVLLQQARQAMQA